MSVSKRLLHKLEPVRVVYLSRQFNRSGYSVLKSLIGCPACHVVAVVLPPTRPSQRQMARLDSVTTAWFEVASYRLACLRQGARPLRFEGSLHRLAKSSGLNVEMIASLKDVSGIERLRGLKPDLIVLGGGWPELLPAEVFELAPLGAINTHPSLLPDYRGTDVQRWQVLDGVKISGTTIHYIDGRFDTGDILAQRAVPVDPSATPQQLFQSVANSAGTLMVEVIERIQAAAPARVVGIPQSDSNRKSLPLWPWNNDKFLRIDPTASATQIERHIRATTQESYTYDGAWLSVGGRKYIVRRASLVVDAPSAPPGTLLMMSKKAVLVCGEGALRLDRVQERSTVPMATVSRNSKWFVRHCLSGFSQIPVDEAV